MWQARKNQLVKNCNLIVHVKNCKQQPTSKNLQTARLQVQPIEHDGLTRNAMQRQTRKAKVETAAANDPRQVRVVNRIEDSAKPRSIRPERSYRSTVLAAITAASTWSTAHDLTAQTQLTYPQVIFALHALHNSGQIARAGRKFTARWGALSLVNEPTHNFELLEQLFHGIVNN
jgi:hypothetical protein